MSQNKIFTTLNQPLNAQFYSLANPDSSPASQPTLEGIPLGTSNNSVNGELAVKVIVVAQRNGPAGVVQQASVVKKTANYTIPSGAFSFSIAFSSDFAGTVGGLAYDPLMHPYQATADTAATLDSFALTISAGYALISTLISE